MRRRSLVKLLSIVLPVVLSAATVVASARLSERRFTEPETTVLASAKTPYELRILDPDPNTNPFAGQPGGPGAPPLPTLPGDSAGAKTRVSVPPGIPALQKGATQRPGEPGTYRWALIVAINDYAGGTRDNIGSYQDGVALRDHLLGLGWRGDHILLIANRQATKPQIMEGLRWLAAKTDASSTAIFHYSGHEKPFKRNADGDREKRDVGLWVSDNNLISDGELGVAMGLVGAGRMWINMAVCRAGGFSDPGMSKPGRVITYSSPESELSYEDPDVRYSVFGYNMIVRGMRKGLAELGGDGGVSVEEAFHYSVPYVVQRTEGNQNPVIDDRYQGDFDLRISS